LSDYDDARAAFAQVVASPGAADPFMLSSARTNVVLCSLRGSTPFPDAVAQVENAVHPSPMVKAWTDLHGALGLAALDRVEDARRLLDDLAVPGVVGALSHIAAAYESACIDVELMHGPWQGAHSQLLSVVPTPDSTEVRDQHQLMLSAARRALVGGDVEVADELVRRVTDGPGGAYLDLDPDDAVRAMRLRGRIASVRNDHGGAVVSAESAVTMADRHQALVERADARLDLAHVLAAAGRPQDARTPAEEALLLYRRKGHVVGARQTEELLAALADRGS
jgi:hypothetical protein